MEKLKRFAPPTKVLRTTAYPYAFLHFNRKLWDLQEFVNCAGRTVTPVS